MHHSKRHDIQDDDECKPRAGETLSLTWRWIIGQHACVCDNSIQKQNEGSARFPMQEGLGQAGSRARGRQKGGLGASKQEGLRAGKHTLRVAARRCMMSGSSSSRVSLSNLPRLLMWPYSASSRCCSALFTCTPSSLSCACLQKADKNITVSTELRQSFFDIELKKV